MTIAFIESFKFGAFELTLIGLTAFICVICYAATRSGKQGPQ